MLKLFHCVLIAGLLYLTAAFETGAAEDPGLKIGVLTCKKVKNGGVNLLIHSSAQVTCVFTSRNGIEKYQGETGIMLGIDLEWDAAKNAIFTVFSLTNDKNKESYSLSGKYIGARASATIGVGLGVQVLVGAGENHFTLQPLVIEDKVGFGAAAGIGYLYLEADKGPS